MGGHLAAVVGPAVGATDGVAEGFVVVGTAVLGLAVGTAVVGRAVLGLSVGTAVVGTAVLGLAVGRAVVGLAVGTAVVGLAVGKAVGLAVGAAFADLAAKTTVLDSVNNGEAVGTGDDGSSVEMEAADAVVVSSDCCWRLISLRKRAVFFFPAWLRAHMTLR